MTPRRAALIAALVALLVYLPALGNRFALDDGAIVERNPAAHSVGAALGAFAHPYWPPEHGAGLYRPMVILSFAADWQLSGGSAAWLHATNLLLHALVTALLVLVLAPWVTALGALAGGLIFATHPVHVEAVANLVGRAELMAALGILAAMLLARAARGAASAGRSPVPLEIAAAAAVLFALLSKEHAIVAIAILWLDDRMRAEGAARQHPRFFVVVGILSLCWLVLRNAIEGGVSFDAVAPTFFQLDTTGRLSTMLPAVLVVVRLLVWPFDLSPDYHPRVIERLESPSAAGAVGLVVLVALALLSLALWHRHRLASLGLLVIGLAWLPTSNLFFPTGIVLAERTLYLSSVGIALLAAAGFDAVARRTGVRRAALVWAIPVIAFGWMCAARSPAWRSTRDLVVTALLAHPESYKVHQSAARVYWRLGLRDEGLREYRIAAELYSLDHYLLSEMGSALLQQRRPVEALRILRRSEALDSGQVLTQQLVAQTLLLLDSVEAALAAARRSVALGPDKAESARMLAAAFLRRGQPDSALAVWPAFRARGGSAFERWLLGATTWAGANRPDSAFMALDSARAHLPPDSVASRRLGEARAEVRQSACRTPEPGDPAGRFLAHRDSLCN